jgi:hypothetical protein
VVQPERFFMLLDLTVLCLAVDTVQTFIYYEECRFLECGAVYFLCEPTFRRNVSPSSSG